MDKYEIVLDLCQSHSISKTAQKYNYTQSAVSQTIKSFEKELGLSLFNRTKKGLYLASNTEEIILSIEKICKEKKHIADLSRSLTSVDKGYIRIGSIQSISYHLLPNILKQFSLDYPNIQFELTIDGFHNLKEKLEHHELDCIFVSSYSVPNLPFIRIAEDELMLVAPLSHPLSKKINVSLADLSGEDFILSSDGLDYETGQIFKENNIVPSIKYRLNEDYATIKFVEQNFGITILPKLLLYHAPFDVCVRSFTEHYTRTLGVSYSHSATPSSATSAFLNYVKTWTP